MDLRIVLGCALVFALAAAGLSAAGGRDYRARSFLIQVPPEAGSPRGVELARGDPVLRRALALAGESGRSARWLRQRSSVQLTSRDDLVFTVDAPGREQAAALATGYAKAFRRSIPDEPGLLTRGRGARDARQGLGPLGWALLGGAAGLWVGTALAIVRHGRRRASGRAPGSATQLPMAP